MARLPGVWRVTSGVSSTAACDELGEEGWGAGPWWGGRAADTGGEGGLAGARATRAATPAPPTPPPSAATRRGREASPDGNYK